MDEDAKAEEMDEAIQAIINDPGKASMSAEQIAAFYELMDQRNCTTKKERPATKKRPEIIGDDDAPVPTAQISAAYEAMDSDAIMKLNKKPDMIADDDAPVPAAQLAATYEAADESKKKILNVPSGEDNLPEDDITMDLPDEDETALAKRRAIQRVMRNTSLTPAQRSRQMQEIMRGNFSTVVDDDDENPPDSAEQQQVVRPHEAEGERLRHLVCTSHNA